MTKSAKSKTNSLERYIYLLYPFGALVIGFLLFGLLIWPKIGEISEIRAKTKKNEDLASEVGKKVRLMQSMDEEVLRRQSQVAATALPGKKNIYDLVVVMKNIASRHGFKVETLKIAMGEIGSESVGIKGQEEESKEDLKNDQGEEVGTETEVLGTSVESGTREEELEKLPIKVELVGAKEDYLDLLLAMEEAIPLLSINRLDLKSKNEAVGIEMTVAIYFSPPIGGLDLDKISLADLMMTEGELAAAERLEGFENYTSGLSGGSVNRPSVIREDPFRF